MTTVLRTVHVVLPGDVDDPALPSGGNAYDRRVCVGLGESGWAVEEVAVPGSWPRPGGAARAALRRALAALPDGAVVLLDGLVACGVPDVVVPQADRLALVVLVHLPLGDESGPKEDDPAELAAGERAVLHAATAVVVTSPWTAARLGAVHGLSGVHVAHPGVDAAPLARGSGGAGRLMCVGSVTPTKGQDVLVDALATVVDLPWTCAVVGPLRRDPVHVARVRGTISRHDLGGRVRLTGPLTGPPLGAAYDTADLLVVPSRAEAYGMVVTEALARGIPVLGSAVGGIPENVGEDAGLLVPPGDAGALAGALRRWFADPDLRDRLRRGAAVRRAALDGWEVTTRCLDTVLRRCGTPG